jgi:hypothetical protein
MKKPGQRGQEEDKGDMLDALSPSPTYQDSGVPWLGEVPERWEGGSEAFIRRDVLLHAPDAWYDPDSVRTGYEISFTRYIYKPQPLRTLEEIRADILALKKETEGLLDGIIGGKNDESR